MPPLSRQKQKQKQKREDGEGGSDRAGAAAVTPVPASTPNSAATRRPTTRAAAPRQASQAPALPADLQCRVLATLLRPAGADDERAPAFWPALSNAACVCSSWRAMVGSLVKELTIMKLEEDHKPR